MSYDDPTEHNSSETKFGQHKSAASGRSGPSPVLIALIVLAGLAITFVLQNRGEVRTHFLFFTKTSKVWATIAVAIVIGAGLDRLASVWWRRREQKQ